ncbi:HlyD family secretion protein [Erwinia sp. HR93]|uniref:HlyD family secretion protein n=1 Tax=Erwinia sp. HR93 TaxID=3094840 RepID=UPI002ADEE0CA|nr:HlyD family efflux transporter periplasmic adaptor subunit [Erwinia sp. HR93]MEA1062452.1 HlyD family efflux transporter periplasmic adaptor subunit [Erwinia sp. HR93]
MTDSLFRQEALDAQKNKMMGSVSLYCPPYRWLVILLVSFFTILIMGFLFFGHYTKRETASGQLLPKDGVYNVTAPSTGTVTRMLVKEGSKVEKGMPLLEISSEISTSMGQTREFVRSQLIMQQARLKAQLEGVQELAQETSHGLKNQLTTLDSQVGLLKQQQSQRRQQLTLAQRQLEKLTAMRNEGFASNHQIDEQTSNVLESNARLQEVNRQSMELEQRIFSLKQQLREQPLNTLNQQREIERKLADVEQSLAENESHRAIIIPATSAGVVGTMLAKTGQVVNTGQPLLYLLPENSTLQAKLMVSSRAIGFINPGQEVILRYEAYPYQKFGVQRGKVAEVSTATLSPQEVMSLTGNNNVQEKLYQVTVNLDRQDISLYGKTEPLRSGIKLEADFLIEKRRIIEWAFEPLYALGKRL